MQYKSNSLYNLCLIFIFCFAVFLRFYQLEFFPAINQDELSNIYDGKAILDTGADRSGIQYPFIVRGYGEGDYRPALFAWLSAATHSLFGYSIWSGRFVSAFLSLVALVLLYKIAITLFDKWGALLALFIAVISPWHFEFARIAHEGTMLPPFFLILTLYLWMKAKETNYQNWALILLLGFELGFSTNAYQATKLTAFCILPLICCDILIFSPKKLQKIVLVSFFWILGAAPQIYILFTEPIHFAARAVDTTPSPEISTSYLKDFFLRFISNLLPQFLFFNLGEYIVPSFGRLSYAEFPLFYLGIVYFLFRSKKDGLKGFHFLLLLGVSIIPAAITVANPHALRSSSLLILAPLFTTGGFILICQKLKNIRFQQIFIATVVLVMISNAIWNFSFYYKIQNWQEDYANNLSTSISKKIATISEQYDVILIEESKSTTYLYIAFFCGIEPNEFESIKKVVDNSGRLDFFNQLGKYHFVREDQSVLPILSQFNLNQDILIVTSQKLNELTLIDQITESNEGKTFYFYKSNL